MAIKDAIKVSILDCFLHSSCGIWPYDSLYVDLKVS